MNISTESAVSVPQIQVMASTPVTKSRREPRDTGFPEPLSGDRNTTLPHPDADLSPNACISQDDINPERVFGRSRRSFLRKKHRHTLQHGKITPQSEAVYSVLSLVSSTDADEGTSDSHKPSSPTDSVRFSKDGTDSVVSRKDDETPPTSPDVPSRRSKKGLLSRWRKDEDDRRS